MSRRLWVGRGPDGEVRVEELSEAEYLQLQARFDWEKGEQAACEARQASEGGAA